MAKTRLTDESRFVRVRDLEHQCRLYVNAYVMALQGNRTMQLSLDKARAWGNLMDIMFGILVQEGVVEKHEEADDGNESES